MNLEDIEYLETAVEAEQVNGGTSTTIKATATAVAVGQITYAGAHTRTFSSSKTITRSSS